MSYGPTALLVSPTRVLAHTLADSLRRAGYRLTVVQTFDAAKRMMNQRPDLVITELKLAEYNGLQLALRGQAMGIPSIVIADKSFEQEVEQLGAAWLSTECAAGEELEIILGRVLHDSILTRSPSHPWTEGIDSAEGVRNSILSVPPSSFPELLH